MPLIATQSRPGMAGNISDESAGETVSRAVRAARDLLATLAGSTEGVSLVSILTQAVLENRGAIPVKTDTASDDVKDPAPTSTEEPVLGQAVVPGTVPGNPDDEQDGDVESDPPAEADTEPSGDDDPDGLLAGFPGERDDTAARREEEDDPVVPVMPASPRTRLIPRRREPLRPAMDPETDEDYDMQFGMRVPMSDTYYPNLPAFVECFISNVFPYHQSAVTSFKWVSDWWRYPALVFPLDAIWRAYEVARKSPGQMMIWYIQASSMLDRVFDKDRGIVASLDAAMELTSSGDPLPCKRPNKAWRAGIVDRLSVPRPEKTRSHGSLPTDKEE